MLSQNTPFTVSADHDGADTNSYRLYINGPNVITQEQPVSALVGGVISFPVPQGLSRGQYTIEIAASNTDGEAKSQPLLLIVSGAVPTAPVNVRITFI